MDIKCTLETRKSKAGNDYDVLVVKLTDTYDKLVFLEKSEIELLKMSKNQEPNFPDFN